MAKKKGKPAASRKRRSTPRLPVRKKPESLRVRESSFSLTVNDLQRSLAWYRDVLGFTEGERWETDGVVHGVQLKAGAVDLMLNQDDFTKGRDRQKGLGVRLWFSTQQSLDSLADLIRGRGGALDYGPDDTPWGDRAFGITDPDGFRITFVAI